MDPAAHDPPQRGPCSPPCRRRGRPALQDERRPGHPRAPPERALLAGHAVRPEPHLQRRPRPSPSSGPPTTSAASPRSRPSSPDLQDLQATETNQKEINDDHVTCLPRRQLPEEGRVARDGHQVLGCHGDRPRPRRRRANQVRRRPVATPDPPRRTGRDRLPRVGGRLRGGPRPRREGARGPRRQQRARRCGARGGPGRQPDPRVHRPVGLPPRGDLGPEPRALVLRAGAGHLRLRHRCSRAWGTCCCSCRTSRRGTSSSPGSASGCRTRSSSRAGSTPASTTATRATTRWRSGSARPGSLASTT